jgi:hypothetical protein
MVASTKEEINKKRREKYHRDKAAKLQKKEDRKKAERERKAKWRAKAKEAAMNTNKRPADDTYPDADADAEQGGSWKRRKFDSHPIPLEDEEVPTCNVQSPHFASPFVQSPAPIIPMDPLTCAKFEGSMHAAEEGVSP